MSQLKKREKIYPSSTFSFYLGPQEIRLCPETVVKLIFIQAADSILIYSRDILTDTPRNKVSPAVWASSIKINLTYKINHNTFFVMDTQNRDIKNKNRT